MRRSVPKLETARRCSSPRRPHPVERFRRNDESLLVCSVLRGGRLTEVRLVALTTAARQSPRHVALTTRVKTFRDAGRTLERKPAAMAKLEGGPGQRRLAETLLRKLLDFARRLGLGHPMTSLRRLFSQITRSATIQLWLRSNEPPPVRQGSSLSLSGGNSTIVPAW